MCEYCDGEDIKDIVKVRSKIEQMDIYVDFTSDGEPILAMETTLDGCSAYHFADINFCPMCGRALRGAANERG